MSNTESSLEQFFLALLKKVSDSKATKLYANLLNIRKKIKMRLVSNTIQWLNCVEDYLDEKIKYK